MRWLKIVSITIIATAVLVGAYYPFSPGGRQHRNMAIARQHLPHIRSLLRADARFDQITAADYTGDGGSLLIAGFVRADQDLTDLKRQVESTAPPVTVVWQVRVIPPPLFDELGK